MNWIDNLKSASVVFFSSVFAFLLVETSYRHIKDIETNREFKNRTMLFTATENFKNHRDFFRYFPNKEIRSVTLYSKSNAQSIDDFTIEYDYIIKSNNIGLVMQKNVNAYDRVVLVIGDSFTEGQGAPPWFYELEQSYEIANTTIINLGILGTGPKQWLNQASSLAKDLNLEVLATVINIIPADLERDVWLFKERELTCLYKAICNYRYGFQGYKFKRHETHDQIKENLLTNFHSPNKKIFTNLNQLELKEVIKQSYVLKDLYRYFKASELSPTMKYNLDSILKIKDTVSEKIYINIVSQKDINSSNFRNNRSASRLVDFLQKHQIEYHWCDIPIEGFHKYDSHPNANGYMVLKECTREGLNNLLT